MAANKGADSSSELVDPRWIKKVADILENTDLAEIEVENDGLKLRVARATQIAAPATVYAPPPPAAPQAPATPDASAAQVAPVPASPKDDPGAVTSPMVGTAYTAPEPGAAPFVKVGDSVKEGQTVMIVEAMKTMNPIPAHKSGVVREVLAEDEQPVQYGDPLVIIG